MVTTRPQPHTPPHGVAAGASRFAWEGNAMTCPRRYCRLCGRHLPITEFACRSSAGPRRRQCRACRSRRTYRGYLLGRGREVPRRYFDPQLELREHEMIREAELREMGEQG